MLLCNFIFKLNANKYSERKLNFFKIDSFSVNNTFIKSSLLCLNTNVGLEINK